MNHMIIARRLWMLALAAGLVAAAVTLWRAAPGPAIIVYDKPAPLGLVGLADGQTLRISVAYVKGFDPQPDPPMTCLLQVGFVDAAGNAVGNPHIAELTPGASQSFDLPASLIIGNPHIRAYVRPVVVDLRPRDECPAAVTGELLDPEGPGGIIIDWSTPTLDPWSSAK